MPSTKATKTTNTAAEMLRGLLQDLAVIATYPDADLEFITGIQSALTEHLRQPVRDILAAQGIQPQGGPGGPMGGGAMGTFPSPPGGGVPGIRQEAAMPPVDELRRLIGGVQGG